MRCRRVLRARVYLAALPRFPLQSLASTLGYMLSPASRARLPWTTKRLRHPRFVFSLSLTQNGFMSLSPNPLLLLLRIPSILAALSLLTISCGAGSASRITGPTPKYGYEVVHVYPHDRQAFTQGLAFRDGKLLESTGQQGRSSLRSVDLDSGQVLRKVDVGVCNISPKE